jgi:hypothetical protein
MLQSYSCVLCGVNVEETLEHIFLHCSFARNCWQHLGFNVPSSLVPSTIVAAFKTQLSLCRCFLPCPPRDIPEVVSLKVGCCQDQKLEGSK